MIYCLLVVKIECVMIQVVKEDRQFWNMICMGVFEGVYWQLMVWNVNGFVVVQFDDYYGFVNIGGGSEDVVWVC